ncbi:tetratricopeptide repeat-containing sulfotransferase family protein [Novosphingobium olei]|uniref:Tetratricopeptide repeat protein n=1 Tax=Novosphingobium olei TaxID=2728851 RepID=A0A7Y0BQ40_9SPHN|nr:sulfotransferase family protein [Novosphingobium olei]NML94571.1 tetratricopeptide repeat protein [Novosphingobium olei]
MIQSRTATLADIDRALDRDDIAAAAEIAEVLFADGGKDPILFNLLAWKRENEERFAEAEELLQTALQHAPGDPTIYVAMGIVRRKQGHLRESVDWFERAIELDPQYSTAWYERGASFEKGGAIADAAADYRRALELEPHNAAAHASLAATEARQGHRESARTHASRALELDPASIPARAALAQIAMESGAPADVVELLVPVVSQSDAPKEALVNILTLLGDAYHRLRCHDDAFQAYARAQALFREVHSARMSGTVDDPIHFVEQIDASVSRLDGQAWPTNIAPPLQPCSQHVFLTGYPRSGTTLVENILATLPGALAIEERPTLVGIDRQILAHPDGVERLAALNDEQIEDLRQGYWSKAREAAGENLEDRLFVDMDPFKGARLPAIARLFPAAKVIIMRRDPRDVVWSCFHTGFAFNAGTIAFSSLESTARHYDATWRVIEASLERFPIDQFNLRYDRLVQDFDETTQSLCAWLGVRWTEELRTFDRTAKERGVSTASATQVRRGLYDGRGSWEPYAEYLKQVEPILRPWIDRFESL